MDPSAQYQQQHQHVDPQSYDPSQYQAYDPSTQAYYAQYHAQYQQQYEAYYSQYYANAYPQQQSQQEPASIHPPGVPIPPQTTHLPGSEQGLGQTQSYYPQPVPVSDPTQAYHGGYGAVPVQGGARPPIGHSAYRGGGRRGSRPSRGGSRGQFGSRPDASGAPPSQGGRGRGRGRGANNSATTPAQGQWPPPRMAWCELCRVDCNTHEILEQHKNGKRHKKNLQVFEELQKLNRILVEGPKEPEPNNGSDGTVQEPDLEKAPTEVGPAEPTVRGTKRKMKVGRGGKRMRRTDDGPKPEVVPLICELCNVKCDSKVVFDTHLMGKKHVLNMKKFQGHQNMLGQAALQALYPALEALYPALQALCQPNAANAAGSSAFSVQVHGPQEYGAPTGSMVATESAPPALESGGEDSKIEGGGTQKDVIEEGENQPQPAKVELEPEQTASVDASNENRNVELGKKDVVDVPVDDSVVAAPSEGAGTEA